MFMSELVILAMIKKITFSKLNKKSQVHCDILIQRRTLIEWKKTLCYRITTYISINYLPKFSVPDP